jgi:hypothetical protein
MIQRLANSGVLKLSYIVVETIVHYDPDLDDATYFDCRR